MSHGDRQKQAWFLWLACASLGCGSLWAAGVEEVKPVGGAAEETKKESDKPWIKIQTQDMPLRDERQPHTPGLYDAALRHTLVFPADGKPVDLELPHEGKDKDGKPLPALMGSLRQGFVWLDLNGNGKQDPKELAALAPGGSAGPFVWNASYEDGTSGPYAFKLVDAGEPGKAYVLRSCCKQAKVLNTSLLLFDDSGNGRYDDLGRDALLAEGRPVTLVSRQVVLDGKLYELLVHPAGQTLEVRPLEGVQTGTVNLFMAYKRAQKAENLKIHTLVISSRDGAFSFNEAHPSLEVPAVAYDLVFGLFERAAETVVLKKGERTSFQVEVAKTASPAWGAPIELTFTAESNGKQVTVTKPVFRGAGSEVYEPQDFEKLVLRAFLARIWLDKRFNNHENFEQINSKKFEVLPNGELKPVLFDLFRKDDLQISLKYQSGILGSVEGKDRLNFIPKRAP